MLKPYKSSRLNRQNRHTAGKISIEHITMFLSKYISKGAVDLKVSPDVGSNQSESIHTKTTKQLSSEIRLSDKMERQREKVLNY